jgi:hypothetical protein
MEDNIKIELSEIPCEIVDRINLAKDWDQWRGFMNTIINLRVP